MYRNFLVVLLLALSPPSKATIGIAIREVDFKNNADYAKVFITLRNGTDSSSTVVDIDALIYQNISAGLQLRLDLAAREATSSQQYLTLLESTVDVCTQNSSEEQQNLLVTMMMHEMDKYGNLSIECPFATGNYAVRNFHIDTNDTLIRLAPPGEYRVGIDVKHKAENRSVLVPVFDIKFYATIFVNEND